MALGGEGGGRLYTYHYTHHQNDSCIKMGSDESHFNVSVGCDGQSHKIALEWYIVFFLTSDVFGSWLTDWLWSDWMIVVWLNDCGLCCQVARGNCFLHIDGGAERGFRLALYGLKKFTGGLGDDDDRDRGDNHTWQRYFTKVRKILGWGRGG